MLDFKILKDDQGKETLHTSLHGKPLLTTPQLNKGTAFTEQERHDFHLEGKLPARVESLEEQAERCYAQYSFFKGNLARNIYLNSLHDTNQTLFYRLVTEHLEDMMPTIYTPIVGTAVKEFSMEFRHPRGLYLAYPQRDKIDEILANRSHPEVDIIVTSDGEGVLGIGDQGIGGMDIPVAKLMVYSLCGGINPLRTLPIFLDVGTNNEKLLENPLYLGWRHKRINNEDYDAFAKQFVDAVNRAFPKVFLHWEDFGSRNARVNLDRFRNNLCSFNDDIQGTAIVTLAALLSAVNKTELPFTEQRIVIFGAGSAGTGIADQILAGLMESGLSEKEARNRFWLLDRPGLLTEDLKGLSEEQQSYAHAHNDVSGWQLDDPKQIVLADVVRNVKPTILIGTSAVTGAFSEAIIKNMAEQVAQPIIFPLSNPTERCEATPEDILKWTQGRALIATGSPFEPVKFNGETLRIAQCNNALAFPGLGLGIVTAKATNVSDKMLMTACKTLSEFEASTGGKALLPTINDSRAVAKNVGIAVAEEVFSAKLNGIEQPADLAKTVAQNMWVPHYMPYQRTVD